MEITNVTDLRKNLKAKLDIVSEDKQILVIHRAGQEDVVMITLSEFNSWVETNYLMTNEKKQRNTFKRDSRC